MKLTEELHCSIIRCLTNPLYADAPLDEVADACETSVYVVQRVLDSLRMRQCLSHAQAVNEQLGMGLDYRPDMVITVALEFLYSQAPEPQGQRRRMEWLMRRLGVSESRATLALRARRATEPPASSEPESEARSGH